MTTRRMWNGLEALSALPYYLLICCFTQPRRMARFLEHLFDYQRTEKVLSGNQRSIPTVEPEQLFPNLFESRVSFLDLGSRPSGTTFWETYIMVCLIKFLRPQTIFEFGTYEGRTTLQFCLNTSHDAKIFTVDLPPDAVSTSVDFSCTAETTSGRLPVGALLKRQKEAGNITQLLQDSTKMDVEVFQEKVDFLFIDGDHRMKYVKSDSEKAFSMLSPRGVILWHDYGGRWPDVARYLGEIAGRKRLYHLARTSLVVYAAALQDGSRASH